MSENSYRSGFVTLAGRPNVGKSTLLNALLGEKVAIVTPKPQTTRDRILGIHTDDESQLVFLDTPGIHRPFKKLNRALVDVAVASLKDADVVALVIDVTEQSDVAERGAIPDGDTYVLKHVQNVAKPTVLVVNKIDRLKDKRLLLPIIEVWKSAHPFVAVIPTSATHRKGLQPLMAELLQKIPEGPQYYEADQFTDRSTRFLVSEIVREKVFLQTGQEIPYSVAVEVEQYKRHKNVTDIAVVIHVERDGQKGIVIGKGGAKLKAIGTAARKDIEDLLGRKVMLRLFVHVQKDWTERQRQLDRFGYGE